MERLWQQSESHNDVASSRAIELMLKFGIVHGRDSSERDIPPKEALLQIAKICPEVAATLASTNGMPFPEMGEEQMRTCRENQEQVSRNWIQDNPQRAAEYAEFFMRAGHAKNVLRLAAQNGEATA